MSTEENKEKYITIMNNLTCSLGTYTGEFGKMKSYAYGKYAAQGEGTWLSEDGFNYKGTWYDDRFYGYGVLTCSNGAVYSGTWKNNLREGFGEYKDPDGHVYVGRWSHDECQGQGKITYSDGHVYVGKWCQGKPFGKGTMFNQDGSFRYKGIWKGSFDDNIESRTFSTNEKKIYPDGSAYEGEFNNEIENDRALLTHTTREGNGIMTYPDGSIYEGEWTCDHRDGKGKMTYPDGSIYQGEWSGDIKKGVGKLTNPDGSIHHEGVWAAVASNFKHVVFSDWKCNL